MILDQAVITYQGRWNVTVWNGAQEIFSAVAALLLQRGIAVRKYDIAGGFVAMLPGTGGTFDVTADMQIENGMGYGSENDVNSIIRHAVLEVSGNYPTSDSIPCVRNPGETKCTATGQPDTSTPKGNVDCNNPSGISEYISCATAKLGSALMFIGVGLIAAFVLITMHDRKGA